MPHFGYRSLRRVLCVVGVAIVFVTQTLFAASFGTIRGRVFDKDSKDALPGANIMVRGTSLGAAADLSGYFVIHNVPVGSMTLTISFVGYRSVSLPVTTLENQDVRVDVPLEVQTILGQTVVVTAQAKGQMQAINQQLASNTIVSVVSEAKIQELPDFNAAEAIGRLPGVSTLRSSGEANKVVLRGLAPQYNLVSVDNITLPSTGKDDRSVDLTMISPFMLQSIDVYKALTPDMEANAIGGAVNMQLREAPSGLHSDLMWQSGYTAKNKVYSNFKAMGDISDRFFNDKLGVYFLLNAEQYDRGADNMTANYRTTSSVTSGFAPVMVTGMGLNRHYETRNRYGGNLILDYRLPSGSIQAINMVSRLRSNYTDYYTNYDYIGLALGWNYQHGQSTTDIAVNALQAKYDFGIFSVDVSGANSYSRNFNPYVPNYTFTEASGANSGIRGPIPAMTPPENLFNRAILNTSLADLSQVGYNTYDFKENDRVIAANFKVPFNLLSTVSGYFKFGGKYRYTHRVNDENAPYAQLRYQGNDLVPQLIRRYPGLPFDSSQFGFPAMGFTSPDQSIISNFLDGKFGDLLWAPQTSVLDDMTTFIRQNYNTALNWHDGDYENKINDYDNVERYYASYVMGQLDLGPALSIVGGVRYELDATTFKAWRVQQQQNSRNLPPNKDFLVTVRPKNSFWLPMVQAKYSATDWMDVRYSLTKTIARPNFTQLSPYENADLNGNYVNAGNPKLRPAVSWNHDVMVTAHNNDIGLLSVGGFYKTIDDFSYFIQYPLYPYSTAPGYDTLAQHPFAVRGAKLSTFYNNPYTAYIRGVEVDFQHHLWYLPDPFSGIIIGVNYTHIKSNTNYPTWVHYQVPVPPRGVRDIIVDSARTGRLINQPDDIVNASIGYDYLGFSARLSFLFQGNMVSGIGTTPEQDGFTHDYFRMDASVRQKLPWEGLQVYLDINNINARADISAQQTIGGFTSEQFYGLTADLGIRYSF